MSRSQENDIIEMIFIIFLFIPIITLFIQVGSLIFYVFSKDISRRPRSLIIVQVLHILTTLALAVVSFISLLTIFDVIEWFNKNNGETLQLVAMFILALIPNMTLGIISNRNYRKWQVESGNFSPKTPRSNTIIGIAFLVIIIVVMYGLRNLGVDSTGSST